MKIKIIVKYNKIKNVKRLNMFAAYNKVKKKVWSEVKH